MTRTWTWPSSVSPVRRAHAMGLAAVLAGAGFWACRLYVPEVVAPPAQSAPAASVDPAAATLAAWLGPGPLRLNVSVIGLISRHDRAVAVLSVNGAAPKAFMPGELLMRDVRLVSIEPAAVTLNHGGDRIRIAAPPRPDYGPPGLVRAP